MSQKKRLPLLLAVHIFTVQPTRHYVQVNWQQSHRCSCKGVTRTWLPYKSQQLGLHRMHLPLFRDPVSKGVCKQDQPYQPNMDWTSDGLQPVTGSLL